MKVLKFCVAGTLTFFAFTSIALAEEWTCLTDIEGVEAYASGDMESAPNYTVSKNGGARVQDEHPDTYMFGQAKFIGRKDRTAAVCQYSNHVGWVVTYVILGVETVDDLAGCKTGECKLRPHWRSEWTESSPEGPKGQDRMHVCVQTVDGLDRPSADCSFTGYTE